MIFRGFSDDPRNGLVDILFALLLTPLCLFVGRLIRGPFLGFRFRSLFLWHEPMIAQLMGQRPGDLKVGARMLDAQLFGVADIANPLASRPATNVAASV